MKIITGVPASPGLAMGTLRRVRHARPALGRTVRLPRHEAAAFEAACAQAHKELEKLEAQAQDSDKEIFMVQRIMLADSGLRDEIVSYIRAGAGAAAAVERAAGIFSARIRALDDPYLRERACDVMDACRRVVNILDGAPRAAVQLAAPAILVADELYPTDIMALPRAYVLGFVTSLGAPTAHAAIIARTMGIPAVVMAGNAVLENCEGMVATLDGAAGNVCLAPDDATRARFSHSMHLARRHTLSQEILREHPCVTQDGTRIGIYANCSSVQDVETAVEMGAEGIVLLLSEYLLMAGKLFGQEEQYHYYAACLAAAKGRPVTISTYDVGADKTIQEMTPAQEANPALGLRGLRYSLANKQFFKTQLAALLRAGLTGNLRIMLPMVATREDLERALAVIEETKTTLRARGVPFAEKTPVGVMMETPAAALMAETLAGRAAFFQINSNSMAQYTHAADRVNPLVREYLPPVSPAVQKLIGMAVRAARAADIPVCVCGESAAVPERAQNYVRLGVRTLSMVARSMDEVKAHLNSISLEKDTRDATD